jgi:hypothetical protein
MVLPVCYELMLFLNNNKFVKESARLKQIWMHPVEVSSTHALEIFTLYCDDYQRIQTTFMNPTTDKLPA